VTNWPDLHVELGLFDDGASVVIGVDEVGRGALAGPVAVGAVAIDAAVGAAPAGLDDSKRLSPARRTALVGPITSWCLAAAVGTSSAAEVDALGITAALGLAAVRALGELALDDAGVLLDGNADWLSPALERAGASPPSFGVHVRVAADRRCASVAAASVVAKVERDAELVELARTYGGYGFESNKGYGSAAHVRALRALGPCDAHRRSWRLPGVDTLFEPAALG